MKAKVDFLKAAHTCVQAPQQTFRDRLDPDQQW
jgi:hypothetical protein